MSIDSTDIGGVVTSSNGPEAGVWVIAETNDLPTRFRKIVVTDDRGRFLLPQLPKAIFKVWVRGYGLVDCGAVAATPGQHLALISAPYSFQDQSQGTVGVLGPMRMHYERAITAVAFVARAFSETLDRS